MEYMRLLESCDEVIGLVDTEFPCFAEVCQTLLEQVGVYVGQPTVEVRLCEIRVHGYGLRVVVHRRLPLSLQTEDIRFVVVGESEVGA